MTELILAEKDIKRFWKYVYKPNDDECWPWTGALNPGGYGTFSLNSKTVLASRVSYHIAHEDPKNLWVLHNCDNRICVNPNHLFLGTHNDNMQDAVEKNRMSHGEKHRDAKLTEKNVQEIRVLYGTFTQKELADQFNVSIATIFYIVKRQIWRHV